MAVREAHRRGRPWTGGLALPDPHGSQTKARPRRPFAWQVPRVPRCPPRPRRARVRPRRLPRVPRRRARLRPRLLPGLPARRAERAAHARARARRPPRRRPARPCRARGAGEDLLPPTLTLCTSSTNGPHSTTPLPISCFDTYPRLHVHSFLTYNSVNRSWCAATPSASRSIR